MFAMKSDSEPHYRKRVWSECRLEFDLPNALKIMHVKDNILSKKLSKINQAWKAWQAEMRSENAAIMPNGY